MNSVNSATMIDQGPGEHWFQQLAAGVFQIQQCRECARYVFYPRVICSHCGSTRLDWVSPSGKGTIYSTTVVRNKPEDGGDRNICLIDLLEGPRMMGCVVGVEPQDVKIGMPVSCRVEGSGDSAMLVWEVDGKS